MRTIDFLKMTAICAFGALVTTSCNDDDDDDKVQVPGVVQEAFSQKYAGVQHVEWEMEANGYLVAEFIKDSKEHDAWYMGDGTWMMTEVDHGRDLTALPQAVQDGYALTVYAQQQWTVDDIDEIQRKGYETIYKIEVEKAGQPDHDLYFDIAGTLFRDVQDQDDDRNEGLLPGQMPAEIQAYVDANYAGAMVVDFEKERNGYELDIRHGGKSIEIRFDSSYNWVQTSTDCKRDIPANILAAVNAAYPGKVIDDCDYIETAAGEAYYLIDLDNYDNDLKVTADGAITEVIDY